MGRIPSNEIYRILSEMKGTVGLYIEDCATGEILKINPELSFPACSVIKIPMAGAAAARRRRGPHRPRRSPQNCR